MIDSILHKIGLTQNEIKIYLALLDLGESKTGDILKKSGLNSGRIYESLDSLQKKGMVSHIVKENIKYFKAADPKRVRDFLEEKKKEIQIQEQEYENVLPELLAKINETKAKTNIEIYTGLKGITTAYSKEFDIPKNITRYTIGVGSTKHYDEKVTNYFVNIHRKKRERFGIKVKKIFSEDSRKDIEQHEPKAEVRYLPYSSLVTIGIHANITIIGIFQKEPIAIVIESEDVANAFIEQFKTMWKIAKE